ncbi:unnamed protein product [Didymodactylos carnosus]|uniref:MULE transposase domain-containing protein n=1 Tax=Didymodactylos carnosus TaxID=1234261 RepID=A0A814ECM3_9BILA|nr:unnamed protein product [Didymodactylos carnosus]CAF1027708.1 unnamed protein product [Didymodactylos carnosus]CAF3743461.1 unnamed protein product [Didymodactylos carnosus]CAF3796110.1 unnamed protein product [Didymodactylos carnosus]
MANEPTFIRQASLEASQVVPLFDSPSSTFLSNPPFKPKAGEVYVLKLDPGHESDENIAEEFPHGNSKKNTKPFFRTRPSLLNKLINEAANGETAAIYRQLTGQTKENDENDNEDNSPPASPNNGNDRDSPPPAATITEVSTSVSSPKTTTITKKAEQQKSAVGPEILSMPRNIEQIRNVKRRLARRLVASADEISELYRFARETPNFIARFTLIPHVIAVAFCQESVNEFNQLLDIEPQTSKSRVLITFDSSFNINNFYITCVYYRHIAFHEEPCILLGCALHNRKTDDVYDYLLTYLKQNCAKIEEKCLYVVDSESNSLTQEYLSEYLKDLKLIHTWNYVFTNLRSWLLNNGRTQADYQFYNAELKSLLICNDTQAFYRLYERCKSNWTQEFKQYFEKIILPLIETDLGSWILKKYDIYDPYCGIRTMSCDAMNIVVTHLRDWRDARFDTGAISLYWLQIYFVNQIHKSFCRNGLFNLKQTYEKFSQPIRSTEDAIAQAKIITPDKIVEHVRGKFISVPGASSTVTASSTSKYNQQQHQGQTHILKRTLDNAQILTLAVPPEAKHLKTTFVDQTTPCIITGEMRILLHQLQTKSIPTGEFKPLLGGSRTMTVRRVQTVQPTTQYRIATATTTNQQQSQPQQYHLITTPHQDVNENSILCNTTDGSGDSSLDLSQILNASSATQPQTIAIANSSFLRPICSSNVVRLTERMLTKLTSKYLIIRLNSIRLFSTTTSLLTQDQAKGHDIKKTIEDQKEGKHPSPHKEAPVWSEKLASRSEEIVKADKLGGGKPTEQLQKDTISHVQKKDKNESTRQKK